MKQAEKKGAVYTRNIVQFFSPKVKKLYRYSMGGSPGDLSEELVM